MNTSIVRDQYWREKTANQKLEVVADLLAQAHRTIRALTERLDELGQHGHHPHTGHVMVPPRDQYGIPTGPPGYCHEDFLLGKAPAEHYGPNPGPATAGWAGEAFVEGALPTGTRPPAPATGPENQPEKGSELPVYATSPPLEDPDWPKPPGNPHFHRKVDER